MTVALTSASCESMAPANVDSESMPDVTSMVTAASAPVCSVMDWPWVSSSLAEIPLRFRTPLVLAELGSTPTETRPPLI